MKPSENSGFLAERREYKTRLELTLLKWLSRFLIVIDAEKYFSSSLKALITKTRNYHVINSQNVSKQLPSFVSHLSVGLFSQYKHLTTTNLCLLMSPLTVLLRTTLTKMIISCLP